VTIDRAFASFYLSEAPSVFRTVYLLCRDPSVAEDATQEAFARALQRWGRLQGQPWVGGWVTQTALNVARRTLRHHPIAEASPPSPADPELGMDLWREVAQLPLRQQQAVILFYREDRPVEEIARIMGCQEGTVRTHLARARRALRAQVEGEIHAERR
jgi:RNA polymerase sigma factor (sigma-70 family)